MKRFCLFIFIFISSCKIIICNAQTSKPFSSLLAPTDSVFMLTEGEQKWLQHTFKSGQTLYSIAKFYAVELSDIYYANPVVAEKGSKAGQVLKIPISIRAIKRSKGANFIDTSYAKVYYKVKQGETFYRLSNTYFKMPIETIQKMNKLPADAILKTGQTLHVGWLSRAGIPDSLRRYNGLTGVLLEKNNENKQKYDTNLATKKELLSEGAAYWLKGERFSDNTSLSVMMNGQPIGAIIRIENPMSGRVVYAKVIGAVPENSDVNGAIVVLSPTLAYALGAIDARFFVKVNYLK